MTTDSSSMRSRTAPHMNLEEIPRFPIIGLICLVIFTIPSLCIAQGTNTKQMAYELQERCGKTAGQWSKQHGEVVDYRAHYNDRLNKCIIFATLAPVVSGSVSTSYYMLYDPNANDILAQYTVRFYPNSEDHICIIKGENYGKASKEKWKSFIKEMMEE